MKKVSLRSLLLLFFLICYAPLTSDRVCSMEFLSPDELIKPINQRLHNDFSVFKSSAYIDRQINRFMERSALKGVSVAVVEHEKLVFSCSYGYANEENGIETSPEHLFRLASVSKLITAVAVMKLVEEGKMNLDDKVFGKEGFFNDEKYLKIRDNNLLDITVLNLLNHTTGWTQRYGDPVFNSLSIAKKMGDIAPATLDTYLKFVIRRKLQYKPGSFYSYSNMAYMFLGAIVEKASGMSYEAFVRYQLLFPNGIYDMHIARNTYEERFPNEVKYYEQDGSIKIRSCNGDTALVSKSYGGNDITLLGAAGGWIASAPELAKFMTLIDGFDEVPDILTKESISQMTGALGNPLGWRETSGGYWYRTGSFAGTAAMIHRRPDGTQWIFLSNTSNWQGPDFSKDINRIMRRILKKVDQWPEQNLFNYFDAEALSFYPILNDKININ